MTARIGGGARQRESKRATERKRQRARDRERESDRGREWETKRETDRERERERDRQTDRQTDRQKDRQDKKDRQDRKDRQDKKDRQDRQTKRRREREREREFPFWLWATHSLAHVMVVFSRTTLPLTAHDYKDVSLRLLEILSFRKYLVTPTSPGKNEHSRKHAWESLFVAILLLSAYPQGCSFFAYNLPAYNGAFLLAIDNFSFFYIQFDFFAYSFSFFTYSWSFFAYGGKVLLIRALRDCKQRSLTVSKEAETVSIRAFPLDIT